MTDMLEAEKKATIQYVVLAFYQVLHVCEDNANDCRIVAVFKSHVVRVLKEKLVLKPEHWLACFLDPSTKSLSMLHEEEQQMQLANIKAMLTLKMEGVKHLLMNDFTSEDHSIHTPPCSAAKKAKPEGIFDRFRDTANISLFKKGAPLLAKDEIQQYVSMTNIQGDQQPLQFWASMEALCRCYLQ